MDTRELAVYVGEMLQDTDLVNAAKRAEDSADSDTDSDVDVGADDVTASACGAEERSKELFLCSLRQAIAETAGDFPIVNRVTVDVDGGRTAPLDSICADGVAAVLSVSKDGRYVRFTVDTCGLRVPGAGRYEVAYAEKIVAPLALTDEFDVGAGVDIHMLAYLTARNYCLSHGRTDEAAIFDQRYDAEAAKKRMKRRPRMPQRKFI